MLTKLPILMALLLTPVQLRAQTQVLPVSKTTKETAAAELEAVIADAGKLDGQLVMINVKAKAAALVSLSDPVRAEMMFLELWRFAKGQTDKDLDKDQALTLILKQLFPRNPKLAKRLLNEEAKPEESSLEARASGHDPVQSRAAKLAAQLVEDDPRAASELLERNLATGMSPAGLNALLRLREKDALLSDFVVAKTLAGLRRQPDVVSMSGLHLLSVYLFPEGGTIELNSSLESLQVQYFSTTHDVLRASLAQSEATLRDQHYTQADRRLRAMYQARLSITLSALASRYQPNLSAELNALANKLGSVLPANVAQSAKLTSARLAGNQTVPDNPEMAIPLALQNGDFESARGLIDQLKSDESRKTYSQLVAKLEAKALLAKSDVTGALTRIRELDDQTARLVLYLEVLKVAQKKRDPSLSRLLINEALSLIPAVDRNGLHVRALLTFASQVPVLTSADDALEFLAASVAAINSLPKQADEPTVTKSGAELAWGEINDPLSLLDTPELAHAFSSVGAVDLERTIIEARKIEVKPVQLVARLEAAGEVIRIAARKPKSKQATRAITRSAP